MPATRLTTAACPSVSRPHRRALWHFSPLQRIAETAAFVPVDFADTIFAAPRPPAEKPAGVPAVPFPDRPDLHRAMSVRII